MTLASRAVYLAGPAVFRRDAHSHGAALKQRCRALGLEPLWPLDNVVSQGEPGAVARDLRQMNCAMIARAVAVIADISPFRGPNMDPGTAFEIGYAAALGKALFLYSGSPHSLRDRTAANADLQRDDRGRLLDADGMEIEDFGLRENLMIATWVDHIYDDVEDALVACAAHLPRFEQF